MQRNENANPPTFFLTMETLLQRMEAQDSMVREGGREGGREEREGGRE